MLHLLHIVWTFLNVVLRGFLIKTFWAWFIVSQFPSLPTISILPAIGFSYFVTSLAPLRNFTAEEFEAQKGRSAEDKLSLGLLNCGVHTFAMVISWGTAWVLHHFM